jgi:hypothetical protein
MENVQKQKIYICHDYSWVPKQFLAHKNKKNMDSDSKLSRNCKEFLIFLKFHKL